MSTTAELLTIFTRVNDRIEKGTDNYQVAVKTITRRAELEDKFAEMLKSVIPDQYDTTDSLLVSMVEELKNELVQHNKYAEEIRKEIIVPANRNLTTMKEQQGTLLRNVKNQIAVLNKAQADHDKIQTELEGAKAKLPTLPPGKQDSQRKSILKMQQNLQVSQEQLRSVVVKEFQTQMPAIHTDFSNYDAKRLTKMQEAVLRFTQSKNKMMEAIFVPAQHLIAKTSSFDGNDRSGRYVAQVFDPAAKTLGDEQDLIAYALSDYRSEEPSDLQFVRGDKIRVLNQHGSGWWEGELNGKKGLFPRSFVELNGYKENKNDPIGAVFLCVHNHEKSMGGDIDLLSGDLVYVDYVIKDKCSGRNLRTNQRGYFPLDSLEQRIN